MEGNKAKSDSPVDMALGFRLILEKYLHHWKWFVLSIGVSLIIGLVHMRYSPRIYSLYAKILLQDEKKASGDMAGLSELANLAGRSSSSAAYVNDQIQILYSRRIMRKVVDANNFHITYFLQGLIRENEILEKESPVKLIILQPNHDGLLKHGYQLILRKTRGGFVYEDKSGENIPIKLGEEIISPIGKIKLEVGFSKSWRGDLRISYLPKEIVVDILRSKVNIVPNKDVLSFAIDFVLQYPSREKGKQILNSLIEQYNNDALEDKAKVFKSTTDFINSRLRLVSSSLNATDSRMEQFKAQNKTHNLQTESKQYLEAGFLDEAAYRAHQVQYDVLEMLEKFVDEDPSTLLPVNLGFYDQAIIELIKGYNQLQLERMELMQSAKEDNPVVQRLSHNLNALRQNIRAAILNLKKIIAANSRMYKTQNDTYKNRYDALPYQERRYKEINRQQKIVESIYLFLLQKLEENEINLAARPSHLKIVDDAYGSWNPVSPRKVYVLSISLAIGFLIPFAVLYAKFNLDVKVHNRDDILKVLDIPIVGDVPRSKHEIQQNGDRSSLAEAMRILKTNIHFLIPEKGDSAQVYFVTSTIAGEGKSFIASNLAKILAMSGSRVLLIGADIRSPKILHYLGLSYLKHQYKGISDFLINPKMQVDEILIKEPNQLKFDLIYSGYIPPNPAELLMNGRFRELISAVKCMYDYVLVDTAPVGLVVDTMLIAELADLTLYVVRANYLDKRLLPMMSETYSKRMLNNMAVVVNDVDFQYDYGYGYGFGYGYGYGDSLNDGSIGSSSRRKWMNKWFIYMKKWVS